MTSIILLCLRCSHILSSKGLQLKCEAFPKGIPEEISNGTIKHTKPYKGDNNIQFQSKKENELAKYVKKKLEKV
jgi:hypothetical protein